MFNTIKISASYEHLKKMIPRFGHSLVIDRRGSLWMFGGYSLSHGALNDLRLFDTKNKTWVQVTVDSTKDISMPRERYFHAAEIVHSRSEIYVYGGISSKNELNSGPINNILGDFWKFTIKNQRWNHIKSSCNPPPVTGHTLTLMKNWETEYLVLIGGFSKELGFLYEIWIFNLEEDFWSTIPVSPKRNFGVYGHSSVFHEPTKSFYIYGGYTSNPNTDFYSNQLFAFHYPSCSWTLLPTFEEYNPASMNFPLSRFFHSSITTNEYMLIFGGKLHESSHQIQTSDLLIAYSYSCNQWIKLLHKGTHAVGVFPSSTYAQSMAYDPKARTIYLVGGLDNVALGDVTAIKLPHDLCSLWQRKEKCRSFLGCSFCSVMKPDKKVTNHCYSSSKSFKESCDYYNGTLITNNGVVCDYKWFSRRNCEHFKTCEECLAKWPSYSQEEPVCKWCSDCSNKRCIFINQTCGEDNKCKKLMHIDQCSNDSQLFPRCTKIGEIKNCSWTYETINSTYTTNCQNFKTCLSCLTNDCRWSTSLRECISSVFQPLLCAGGICGLVLKKKNLNQCPKPCNAYTQCATCLKNSYCGWCSVSLGNDTGKGICTEGASYVITKNVSLSTCNNLLSRVLQTEIPVGNIQWNYFSCPEENECANGHHTCDQLTEVCEDLPGGFNCFCAPGFKFNSFRCEPVCSQGCRNGKCIRPNECLCNFGYVGFDCGIQCLCNGHSNCAGPEKLTECLKCHNNTKGAQCDRCKPLFVGDPTRNVDCVPCFDYCNQHSTICIDDSSKSNFLNKSISELISTLEEGPLKNALCISCSNNTTGRKCNECLEGYFRGTEDLRRNCRPFVLLCFFKLEVFFRHFLLSIIMF